MSKKASIIVRKAWGHWDSNPDRPVSSTRLIIAEAHRSALEPAIIARLYYAPDSMRIPKHIHNISVATSKRVDILNHLKYKLDRKTFETLYISNIRPLLEYEDVVWDNCNAALSDCLELIKKRAGRINTGAILCISTEVLYKELGLTSLKERRKSNRLCLLHKIVNR